MTTGRINQGASLELGSAVRVLDRAPRGSRAARSGDATTNDDGTNEPRQPRACNAFRSLVAIAESTSHERVSFQPPVIEMPVGDTFYLSSLHFARASSLKEKIVVAQETIHITSQLYFCSNGQDYAFVRKLCDGDSP